LDVRDCTSLDSLQMRSHTKVPTLIRGVLVDSTVIHESVQGVSETANFIHCFSLLSCGIFRFSVPCPEFSACQFLFNVKFQPDVTVSVLVSIVSV
jgi:hypothetical protein